jgi:hypothetical protein
MDQSKTTVAQLQVGDVARFRFRVCSCPGRFMVIGRSPEGQVPGFTKVYYEADQSEETLTWQVGNLAVEHLGRGGFVPQLIVFPKSLLP